LSVNVTGATASSTLDILVGGTKVGTLTTDATGAGSVVLSTNPTGTQQAFTTVPTNVAAGVTVAVDTLSGTLATSTHHGGCEDNQHSSFTASLTDPNGTGTGTATVTTSTKHGTTSSSLTVSVTGATASTTLDVLIGTTNVGSIATDTTGAGTLTVTSGLPTIASGTTVSVGTLSGSFAASSNASSSFRSSAIHHFWRR